MAREKLSLDLIIAEQVSTIHTPLEGHYTLVWPLYVINVYSLPRISLFIFDQYSNDSCSYSILFIQIYQGVSVLAGLTWISASDTIWDSVLIWKHLEMSRM